MSAKKSHPTPTFPSSKELAKEIGLTQEDKKVVREVRKKHKPNAAFTKSITPSSTLAAVVGGSPMPRTEVTKKLWAYIKRNGLQDSINRRMINADDNLRQVFGGRRHVSMFEITKLVNRHLSLK